MMRVASAFAFVAATAVASSVSAATLTTTVSKENRTIVLLNGEVAAGDATRLQGIIKSSIDSGRLVSGMRFNSSGGSLVEGVRLAGVIAHAKIATVIPNGATCASACFIAFAAGAQKFVSATATVGVSGASDKVGRNTPDETPQIVRVARELGLPDEIVGRMLITRPDEIFWLTQDDLLAMGATTTGKSGSGALEPSVAAPPPFAPSPKVAASDPLAHRNWSEVVGAALAMSREQNGGQAFTARQCEPKSNNCTTAVFYNGKDGRQVMVRTTKDANGRQLVHEICTFNIAKDVRTCVDWDDGKTHRHARDGKGGWRQIADQ